MSKLGTQFEEDLHALGELLVRPDPLPPSHVRVVASAVVRKWLIDKRLEALGREADCEFTLPTQDIGRIGEALDAGAPVRFFMVGGVALDGVPISGFYVSEEGAPDFPLLPLDSMGDVDLSPKQFLKTPRIYRSGKWFNAEQIIRFVANKHGGVHFDTKRERAWHHELEEAAEFFSLGNPDGLEERQVVDTEAGVMLILPKETGHIWNCLDVELLAITQSLFNVRCDGVPLVGLRPQNRSLLRRLWQRARLFLPGTRCT